MSEPQVNEILSRTLAHVEAIRTVDNGEDQEANHLAHRTIAELFALGMIDRWREEEGEEMPELDDWDWNCEPLAPAEDWSDDTKARFHRVKGDLNLLHSNDAGLNAAKSSYEVAVDRLRAIDPISAVCCYARLLRASAYASYGAETLVDHEEGLRWAAGVAREASVRDEFELSLIEMSRRMLSGAEDRCADSELADLLRSVLRDLLARSDTLPYRRGVPWLALAAWAETEMLGGDRLDPFLALTKTADVGSLRLHAADRAEALEDGRFYRNGGCLDPSSYVEANTVAVRWIRIEEHEVAGNFRDALDLVLIRLGELSQYETQERARLEVIRLRILEKLRDDEAWRAAATRFLEWLERGARDFWWWDYSEVPEVLESLSSKAKLSGDDLLVAQIDKTVRARGDG
jgi:hypothetical protein